MGIMLRESLETSRRYVTVYAQNGTPESEAEVYIALPCEHAHEGEHIVGVDRAEFYLAMQRELGLVDPLSELWTRGPQ